MPKYNDLVLRLKCESIYPKTKIIRPAGRDAHFALPEIPFKGTSLNNTADSLPLLTHTSAPSEDPENFCWIYHLQKGSVLLPMCNRLCGASLPTWIGCGSTNHPAEPGSE